MVNVTTSIVIHRPRSEIAEYASDPNNVPEWYVNISSVEWKTPKPVKIGSRIAFKARFLGRELRYVYEVIEWIPDERLVMKTADGPFPMQTTYMWESINANATRMSLHNAGHPAGFSAILTPFMSLAMKRANRKDLELLKNILERKAL